MDPDEFERDLAAAIKEAITLSEIGDCPDTKHDLKPFLNTLKSCRKCGLVIFPEADLG